MRTIRGTARAFALAGLLLATASGTARAQTVVTPGKALNRYEPAERGSEWFANE